MWVYRERNGTERWAIGDPSFGTRRRRPNGEKWFTKRAAQDALRAKLADAVRGEMVDLSRQPCGDYLDEWLNGLHLAPSTVASYRKNVRLHIKPPAASSTEPATGASHQASGIECRRPAPGLGMDMGRPPHIH